jgi:hypothetical protein
LKFPTKRASEARSRLQECLTAKAEAEAKIAQVNASIERLADHEAEVAAAEQALARIDSDEASATLAWARANEGSAPTPNVDRRDEINRALAVARAQANAAVSARAALTAEMEVAMRPLPGIQTWSSVAVAQIVAKETAPLLADLEDAQRNFAAKIERVKMMHEFVIAAAERLPKGSEEARQCYVSAEAMASDMQRAMAAHQAPLDDVVATRAALREFVSALADDAMVALAA